MSKRVWFRRLEWGLERLRGRSGDDRGAATTILVMGMALALVAGVLLFSRIGHANDLRTTAQSGADAAALAAVRPLRDQAVDLALTGIDPNMAGMWSVPVLPGSPAGDYADKNNTSLVGIPHLSGMLGNTVKVEVETKECQVTNEQSGGGTKLCTDAFGNKGAGQRGKATAIAKLIMPTCVFIPDGVGATGQLICDGVQTYPNGDRDRVVKLFKSRLVDEEDPLSYLGLPNFAAVDGVHAGPNPPSNLPFGQAVVAWAMKWLETPYSWGGGNAAGPSKGICCSPGGFSGANTVGFDCSGLTLYAVYQASGGRIALGHFTGNQFADPRGVHIATTDQLQPGDLVFFGDDLHHVAIYAGDGKVVQAPSTGDVVKVSPLSDFSDFAGGVRFGVR
jgi:cell wall-associated NlpC family hydrolase